MLQLRGGVGGISGRLDAAEAVRSPCEGNGVELPVGSRVSRVMLQTLRRALRQGDGAAAAATHSVEAEDADDLVPLCALVGGPAQLLGEPLREQAGALERLLDRVGAAAEAAGEEGAAVMKRMPAVAVVEHEVGDGDVVGWGEGEGGHPGGRVERHCCVAKSEVEYGADGQRRILQVRRCVCTEQIWVYNENDGDAVEYRNVMLCRRLSSKVDEATPSAAELPRAPPHAKAFKDNRHCSAVLSVHQAVRVSSSSY